MEKTNLKQSIINTLKYSGMFNYPLTLAQVQYYLMAPKKVTRTHLAKTLKELVKTREVTCNKKYYHLHGIKAVSWKTRAEHAAKMIKENKWVFDLIRDIPWVKMLAVTGSVGAYNADANSDLDIMVVCTHNRVWITRGLVTCLLKICGKKTKVSGEKGKICPNIFVSEKNLEWKQRNVFTAHEVLQLQPIFSKDQTYFHFIKANSWIYKYFGGEEPTYKLKPMRKPAKTPLNFLEMLARTLQILYMKSKVTSEILEKNLIHFRKLDNSKDILAKWGSN